ncbi:amidohydrolase [Luteipulveratus halotolerans]|uniref:Amidohydrolase 3 domain-containing protein n=1 Tax=Luteipulveratus halotolerans TaxID=1631356 RepID=A0A0L6CHL9_9MICO|nr:amidohydrolase family protein [Luteipulveratus halotolerans]KNX37090.1 hypothetical protein VV01_07920 [Luteipulveratus halotolerans]
MTTHDLGRSVLLTHGVITDGVTTSSSMAVRDGRVVWTGPDDDATPSDFDEVVDLENRVVTPVFVDAHVHISDTGQALAGIDLAGTRSVTEALDRLSAAAAQRPGRPVFAYSWDETEWHEQRAMTAAELDRACGGAEVYATRIDMHSASASSALVDRAGAWSSPGSDGTGLVARDAHHLVREAHRGGVSQDDRAHFISTAMTAALAAGIGVLHEMGAPVLTSEEDLLAVVAAAREPGAPRVVPYWGELVEDVAQARALADRLGVRGLAGDLNVDGSIGSRTAALREPYEDALGLSGFTYLTPEQVATHVTACTLAGLQAGFHVIGDAGMDCAVDGVRQAAREVGIERIRLARHRFEHAELCHAEHIDALAEIGVVASVQPAFDAFWGGDDGMYAARLGLQRALAANPLADLVGSGVQVALGSDSPVTPFAPWAAVRACVDHHAPAQALDAATALRLHLAGGHAAAGETGGALTPGSEASYVIWDCAGGLDEALHEPAALRTVLQGRVVHDVW